MTPEVKRARARRAVWLGSISAVALGAVFGTLVARALRPMATGELVIDHVPIEVAVEPRARMIGVPKADCSLPSSQIGLLALRHGAINTPRDRIGVAASRTGCTLAVWGARDVDVSRDGGSTFTRIAMGDRWSGAVPAVAVSANETVYIARGDKLLIAPRDGALVTRDLPLRDVMRTYASSGSLIARTDRELAISRDDGVTWSIQSLPVTVHAAAIIAGEDGTLYLAAATARDAPVTYYVGERGAWRAVWTSPLHSASTHAFAFGFDRKLYVERLNNVSVEIFAVGPDGAAASIEKLADPSVLNGATIEGTQVTWGARDGQGSMLALVDGRGPVRMNEYLDHLMTTGWSDPYPRRWIVGTVVP
jgi:hypothetical protein